MFVVIYGRPGCSFCIHAHRLAERLESAKVIEGYRYVDMWAENISKEELAKTIGQPVHTVPQVLIDKTPIGGFTEFDRYVREHALLG